MTNTPLSLDDAVNLLQLIRDLESLYALLDQPYAWCKGIWTRKDKRAPDGYARCLSAAIEETGLAKARYVAIHSALAETAEKTDRGLIFWPHTFNDTHRKRDVLRLIQRTIERVKGGNEPCVACGGSGKESEKFAGYCTYCKGSGIEWVKADG
jgi:hypothetical protein